MSISISRRDVLAYRVRAQQLDVDAGLDPADARVLDLGAQDTGPDGGRWALAIRGVAAPPADELVLLWTLRGAPHLYRRADLRRVAAAVAPFSDADASKRIFDAAKPLGQAGIAGIAALDTVAAAMRSVVTRPTVKGTVSTQLTQLLDPPYLRFCRGCQATHVYEQPFRLAALRAGLELAEGTSPPVLRRIRGFSPSSYPPPSDAAVRDYLRLLGPATSQHVAGYLDAPVREVKARWPAEAREVRVDGQRRWVLAGDDELSAGQVPVARLLGPYDLFLQARDRELLVDDPVRTKELWPVLGRPGAVLVDGEIAGVWRPRKSGGKLRVQVRLWSRLPAARRRAVHEQAERLATFRGVALAGVDH